MAADIEFNVRNGMTVGSNKHLVLDVNGALSGSDISCTTGSILSGGSDLLVVFSSSAVATTLASNSGDWETAHGWGNHATQNYLTSETTTTLALADDTLTYTNEAGTPTTISLAAYAGGGVTTIADATDTTFTSLSGGDVLVYVNGGTQKWQNKKDRASLEDMYNYANANFYSEMTYSITDQLTGVYVWVSDNKSTALFERDLTYNASGQLTSVITRDVQGSSTRTTLTKNLAYTATGALSSTTRSYS